jgi:methionyl-tRNA formyltransferase
MKIIFFGNNIYGYNSLYAMINNGFIPEVVVTNIPNPDERVWYPSVAELATKNNIEVIKINKISGNDWVFSKIEKIMPDLIVVSSFRNILDKKILSIPPRHVINLHMALLPKYRGAHPENWAIINGEEYLGYTVHYLEEKVDSGDIIAQHKVKIHPEDDILSLTYKIAYEAPLLLIDVIKQIERGEIVRSPQNEADATYFPPRTPKDGLIDWTKTGSEIHNLTRALVRPYPGSFSFLLGKKITIWRTQIITKNQIPSQPDEIIDVTEEGIKVQTGDGLLLIKDFTYPDNPVGKNLIGERFTD